MASLQHHGCYTLGLARRLGSVSLANCREPNAIYFNTIGSHMAVYPKAWGKWIVLATAGFFAAVLLFGLARCQLTVTGILAGMVLYLLSAVFSLIVTVPLAALVYFLFHEHALYRNNSLSAALILLGLGILVLLSGIVRQRIRPQHLLAGALAWWLVVLAALQYFAPYGSYAAAWPLASISLGLLALCF